MSSIMKPSVFITIDTHDSYAEVWEAEKGVMKTKGCVCYFDGKDSMGGFLGSLSEKDCMRKYGSFPEAEECWFVEDKGTHWLWTRYDHLYDFDEIII